MAEHLPAHHELTKMIRGVIYREQRGPKDCPPFHVFHGGEDVALGVADELDETLAVALYCRNRRIPGCSVGFSFAARPVSVGPRRRTVLRLGGVQQEVFLRDADVLELVPEAIRHVWRLLIHEPVGKIGHRIFEAEMRTVIPEPFSQPLFSIVCRSSVHV